MPKVDEPEKLIRKANKVTEMNQKKLIIIRIHMRKKKYYKPSENDPPMSPSSFFDLYTYSNSSTEGEVMGFAHDFSNKSILTLTQAKEKACTDLNLKRSSSSEYHPLGKPAILPKLSFLRRSFYYFFYF